MPLTNFHHTSTGILIDYSVLDALEAAFTWEVLYTPRLSSFFTDTSGSTPATFGDEVRRWNPTAGSELSSSAQQADLAKAPVLNYSGDDFTVPHLTFSGVDWLVASLSSTISPLYTMFAIWRPTATPATGVVGSNNQSGQESYGVTADDEWVIFVEGSGLGAGTVTVGDAIPHLFRVRSGTQEAYVNNSLVNDNNEIGGYSVASFAIGADRADVLPITGEICCIGIIADDVDSEDRTALQTAAENIIVS